MQGMPTMLDSRLSKRFKRLVQLASTRCYQMRDEERIMPIDDLYTIAS